MGGVRRRISDLLTIGLGIGTVGCEAGPTSMAPAEFLDSAAPVVHVRIRSRIRLTPRWHRTLVDIASFNGIALLAGGDAVVAAAQNGGSAASLLLASKEGTTQSDLMPRFGSQGLLVEAFRGDTALVFDVATQGLWLVAGPGPEEAARCRTVQDPGVYLVGSAGLEGGALLLSSESDPLIGSKGIRWTSVDIFEVPCDGNVSRPRWRLPRSQILWSPRDRMNLLFGAAGQVTSAGRYLVAGTSDQAKLLVRDVSAMASPWWIMWDGAKPGAVTRGDIEAWSRWRKGDPRDSVRFPGGVVRPARAYPRFSRLLGESTGAVWVEQYRWYTPYMPGPDAQGITTWYRFDLKTRIGHSLDLANTEILVAAQAEAIVTLRRTGDTEWVLSVFNWSTESGEPMPQ